MSNTTVEIVASLKVPVGVRVLGVITQTLSKEYGPGLFMEQNGKMMEFKRNLPKEPEVELCTSRQA